MTPPVVAQAHKAVAAALTLLDAADLSHDPIADGLRRWTATGRRTYRPPPSPLADTRTLFAEAIGTAAPVTQELAAALAPLEPHLRWTDYLPSPWAEPFLGKMATGMLAGPAAPIESDSIAFGVFVVAPNTDYSDHGHEARELYLTVNGDPLFAKDGVWSSLDPGSATIQEPNEVHALRTRDHPMLVFWTWVGAIAAPIWGLDHYRQRFYPPNLRMES